jgi:hypothetical protein
MRAKTDVFLPKFHISGQKQNCANEKNSYTETVLTAFNMWTTLEAIMKPNMFETIQLPRFRSTRFFSPAIRENLKYLLAFVLGLPLAVAAAAYFIDAFITMLVQ